MYMFMKLFKSKKSSLIIYCLINTILILLSLLLMIINIYELTMVFGISFIFNGIYLLLILNFGDGNDKLKNGKGVFTFSALRYIIEIVNLILCSLLIFFIKPLNTNEGFDKLRFIFILGSLISYFVSIVIFYLNAKAREEDVSVK